MFGTSFLVLNRTVIVKGHYILFNPLKPSVYYMFHSFIHSLYFPYISIYRLNTKDVEIVIVVTTSGKVTNIRCFNTIIIQ